MAYGCSIDPLTNMQTDPRYSLEGNYTINEYDLFMFNGILNRLNRLPDYPWSEFDRMKTVNYNAYTRNTVYWSL